MKEQDRSTTDRGFAAEMEALILSKFTEMLREEGGGEDSDPPIVRVAVLAATVEQPEHGVRGFWSFAGENRYELSGLVGAVLDDLRDFDPSAGEGEEG